jgi:tRNA-dihydrouridine synthase 2
MDYTGKLLLAPMVRVGTLPMRLLALSYGADIVYTPEIVDRKLIRTIRIENEFLGTVDYIDSVGKGSLVLRIHPSEKNRLVVQIGSANPDLALQAAKRVYLFLISEQDATVVDLNCGCPKRFSTHNGSGSALLENQDTLIAILEKLTNNLTIPVSCKIRLLDPQGSKSSTERTIELLKRIEQTGVCAIGIHCRFTHERPRQPGHWDVFNSLIEPLSVPIIANGDLWNLEEIHKLRTTTGSLASAFMIARGAQANVSCFRKDGMLPCHHVMVEYLYLSILYDMPWTNAKYTLMQMAYPEEERISFQKKIIACQSFEDAANLFKIEDYLRNVLDERNRQKKS